jgi:hypothetical protein
MIHCIFLLITFLLKSKIFIKGKNIQEGEYPKEINHGILQNDTWNESVHEYEYYINITDYELNEENIFELYCDMLIFDKIDIYTLITNESIDKIEDQTIKPDKDKDHYNISIHSIKIDSVTKDYYLFLPFKKTSINQTYLIILIIPKSITSSVDINYSLSERIKNIKLIQKNNTMELFSDYLEARNDIHLYYKFDIDKNINLTDNNILFFVNNITIPIFITNLTSLKTYDNIFFIIEKNKSLSSKSSEVYFGIKTSDSKPINIIIYLDNNDIYHINNLDRLTYKLYFEKINCDKKLYIIENDDDLFDLNNNQRFLITNKFYGNYSLRFYNVINDIIFDVFESNEEKNGIEVKDKILSIEGKLIFYVLKCTTPTAFNFEYFENDTIPGTLFEGQQYKTFLDKKKSISRFIISLGDEYKQYKLNISLLEINKEASQSLSYIFTLNIDDLWTIEKRIVLDSYNMWKNETLFYGNRNRPAIKFENTGFFVRYYLTSNRLFYNVIEGETIINKSGMENLAFKIKKDLLFDYITFEAESNAILKAKYELIIINKTEMEDKRIFAPLPEINLPNSKKIKFKISNPNNKYDCIIKDNDNNHNFYLIISFESLNTRIPTYVNIKYNYIKQIQSLEQMKSEIISPDKIYEIYGDKNYKTQNKIFFNINRCDHSKKYLFINYYEDYKNIINKNNIIKDRDNIISNNYFYNSKIIILAEDNDKDDHNTNSILNNAPADYYNKGDIILNYFLINEKLYNSIEITNNFTICYEDIMRSTIKLYWNKYISIKSRDIDNQIPVEYSIYILPEDSLIDSMCQLSFVPSNYSVMNSTEKEIEINKGNYKVIIIASVLDKNYPISNIYDSLDLKVSARINIVLVIVLCVIGLIIILIILYVLFRKKRKFLCFKRNEEVLSYKIESNKASLTKDSDKIENNKINSNNKNDEKIKMINTVKEEKEDNDELSEQLIDNKVSEN